VAKLKVWRPA